MDPEFGDDMDILRWCAPEHHEILVGKHDGICSAHDFLANMPGVGVCQEFCRRKKTRHLRVFWYPSSELQSQSIQGKIKSLLLSAKFSENVLVQFWAPIKTKSGRTVLSVLEQPFGVRELCNGFCRYRYRCIEVGSSLEDINQLGPIGRVFKQGSTENCRSLEAISIVEFPLKHYAIDSGIVGYSVHPLFRQDHHGQQCDGVLEILSFGSTRNLDSWGLKRHDFVRQGSHCKECEEFHRKLVASQQDVLEFLKKVNIEDDDHTIDVWVPCICDCPESLSECEEDTTTSLNASRRVNQLFCQCPLFYWDKKHKFNQDSLSSLTYLVRNGKSWVGRAYSLNKPCFFKNTHQCNISDYPIVYRDHYLFFAFPLKVIHPKLPPVILEATLDDDDADVNPKSILKSILIILAQELSDYDAQYEFKEGREFCVEFSHFDEDKYSYFNVYQTDETMRNGETLGNGRALQIQLSDQTLNQHRGETSTGVTAFSNGETEISREILEQYYGRKLEEVAAELGVSRATIKRRCRDFGIKSWPWHKKNKVNNVRPNPIRNTSLEAGGGEVVQELQNASCPNNTATEKEAAGGYSVPAIGDGKCVQAGHDEINHTHTIIVDATYKEERVKFPICSNLGIEDLCRELNESLDLKDERFKIKYEEDGNLFTINRDKELRYRMDVLKSSGQTTMNLSVFPAS